MIEKLHNSLFIENRLLVGVGAEVINIAPVGAEVIPVGVIPVGAEVVGVAPVVKSAFDVHSLAKTTEGLFTSLGPPSKLKVPKVVFVTCPCVNPPNISKNANRHSFSPNSCAADAFVTFLKGQ